MFASDMGPGASVMPSFIKICLSIQKLVGEIHVRFEVFTAVPMKNVVFLGYKNPLRTSQETHYVSATEFSQLMLCKI
jgi:hypothetical protein